MTARSASAPRSTPKGQARRREILDAALGLFSAGGFNSTSIADIAADVGMTQAGLLHHFPSKGALLLAVLQEREERNQREERQRRERGEDWVQAFIGTLATNDQSPALVQLFAMISTESIAEDHPAHRWFADRYVSLIAAATAALEDEFDCEDLPPGVTVETVARLLIALADGWRLQWLRDPTITPRDEAMSFMLQMLGPVVRRRAKKEETVP